MTISTTIAETRYNGTGNQTVFPTTFKFLQNSHVTVIHRDAAGNEQSWVEGTHYTLTGVGNENGGTVSVSTSPIDYTPAIGEILVITRVIPETQETDYPEGGAFPASAHEAALDLLTMMIQKHSAEILRSLIFPISDPVSAIASLPSSANRASKFLAFDTDGKPVASAGLVSGSPVPVSSFIETLLDDVDGGAALTTLINSASAIAARSLLELGTAAVGDIGTDVLAPDGVGSGLSGITIPGKNSIWIPVPAMLPAETTGCASLARIETTAGRPDLQVLDFDTSADEHAQFSIMLPKSWNEGTVTFRAVWTTAGAVTTGVAIGLQAVSVADDESADAVFGTPVLVSDNALGAAEDLMVTAESAALTIGGTRTWPSLQYFDVYRDVSDINDDMALDMRLIGLILHFTTDAGDDT